jgi:hypothetical protein
MGESVCKEVLSAKLSQVGGAMAYNLLSSFLVGDLGLTRLFQTFFNQIVWHAISTQRCPVSIPVKLGSILGLDKI